MVSSNKLYIHFEKNNYIIKKSEFLKAQIDILYLKRKLRDLTLLREKKLHYRKALDETVVKLKKNIERLDELMPVDNQINKILKKKTDKKKMNIQTKEKEIYEEKPKKLDDIETELLRIKEKLNSLNRN